MEEHTREWSTETHNQKSMPQLSSVLLQLLHSNCHSPLISATGIVFSISNAWFRICFNEIYHHEASQKVVFVSFSCRFKFFENESLSQVRIICICMHLNTMGLTWDQHHQDPPQVAPWPCDQKFGERRSLPSQARTISSLPILVPWKSSLLEDIFSCCLDPVVEGDENQNYWYMVWAPLQPKWRQCRNNCSA